MDKSWLAGIFMPAFLTQMSTGCNLLARGWKLKKKFEMFLRNVSRDRPATSGYIDDIIGRRLVGAIEQQ